MASRYALSIDVGTTFTAAATWHDGSATTVTLGEHTDSIPTVLYLREDGVFLVGHAAERRAITDPTRVAREFKRRLGDDVDMTLGDESFPAETLTGHVIQWVVDHTTEREGSPPSHVTLTCPASWGDYRRSLMTQAAAIAGLEAVGLMTEPAAAATYYASLNRLEPGATIAGYDFGGGTCDTAVLIKTVDGFDLPGPPGGDDQIGGCDFDAIVLRLIAHEADLSLMSMDLSDPTVAAAVAQLHAHAVDAKEALSTDKVAEVPVILPGINRTVRITRAAFEDAIREIVLGTVDTLRQTVERAQVDPATLTRVLLVGGSSRIPLVTHLIQTELGVPVMVDAHPKHAVCLGAAVSAATRISSPGTVIVPPREPLPTQIGTDLTTIPERAAQPPGATTPDGAQLEVDLLAAGLTTPMDRPLTPNPSIAGRRHVLSRDIPLVVRLDEVGGSDEARRFKIRLVVLVVMAIALVIAMVILASFR